MNECQLSGSSLVALSRSSLGSSVYAGAMSVAVWNESKLPLGTW